MDSVDTIYINFEPLVIMQDSLLKYFYTYFNGLCFQEIFAIELRDGNAFQWKIAISVQNIFCNRDPFNPLI